MIPQKAIDYTVGPHLSGRQTCGHSGLPGTPPRSAINVGSNVHAHYRLIFELSESARSRGMASVTRKRSVVTLERKLDVIRMLEDGKSQ